MVQSSFLQKHVQNGHPGTSVNESCSRCHAHATLPLCPFLADVYQRLHSQNARTLEKSLLLASVIVKRQFQYKGILYPHKFCVFFRARPSEQVL